MRVFSSASHRAATKSRHTSPVSMLWKVLVVLLLVLPIGAYVTGSLAGSQANLPDQRDPIVVDDPEPSSSDTPESPKASKPAQQPRRNGRGDDPNPSGTSDGGSALAPAPQDVAAGDDRPVSRPQRPDAAGDGSPGNRGGRPGDQGGSGGGDGVQVVRPQPEDIGDDDGDDDDEGGGDDGDDDSVDDGSEVDPATDD